MRLLLSLLLFTALAHAAPDDRPPFFHVQGAQGQAWLLGSVHVGQADFYPFAERIERAFEASSVLALEADTQDPAIAQQIRPFLFAKSPLPDSLSSKLAAYCGDRGMRCDPSLAPWVLSSQLLMAEMARAGYQSDHGVESYFSDRRGERPLWELEGMLLQMRVFDGLSDATQQAMLEGAMEPMDVGPLIQAWRRGDHFALAKLTFEDIAEEPEAWEALMINRNLGMRDTLIDWLGDTRGPIFVVVGAGHLVGEQSVVSLLRKQGLEVTDCWRGRCPTP
ncbi:TraB/GumN family protein [Ferrimonas sediminicola]|uniref:TraB/GumN family protein n=1 Tax=Ferrimonas sediminicola TaxID=2569538 RepID=A0A4U1BL25_9GAMM|nr:TraB/GumN family protein [Ferrimonas sediminicola]TKB51357.1 TraB/GumN family protein [Ferrimonas sediminicola]